MNTVAHSLTGQRMFERFSLTGTHVMIDKSEVLIALCLGWYGIVLLPGWIGSSPLGFAALAIIGGRNLWAAAAVAIGLLHLGGLLLTWLGLAGPVRPLRLLLLSAAASWWTAYALALLFTGATMAPAVYGTLALMSALNYRRVYLNGSAWTLPK